MQTKFIAREKQSFRAYDMPYVISEAKSNIVSAMVGDLGGTEGTVPPKFEVWC